MEEFKRKRMASLIVGMLCEVLCGIIYAFSVFQGPLIEKFGWSVSQVALAFTINGIIGMVCSVLFGAKLKKMLSTKNEVLIGAFFYGGALILMSFMTGKIWELYVYFSVFNAIGNLMIYPVLTSYALELFPERTGFAGGMMTAGYGLGAVLWAPTVTALTAATGDIGRACLILGIFFLIGLAVLSRFLLTPPEGFRDYMLAGTASTKRQEDPREVIYEADRSQMVRLPIFYIMMITITLVLACGGMIINQGSPIMQHQFGLTAGAAAAIVSFLAIANTIGRLVWGNVSDKVGKIKTMILIQAVMAVIMLLLFMLVHNQMLFTIVLMGTTFCYGGAACLVAPITEEIFGSKNIGGNYSVTFSVFGFSGLIGPVVISSIRQSTGEYHLGFLVACVLAVVAFVLSIVMEGIIKARKKQPVAQKVA